MLELTFPAPSLAPLLLGAVLSDGEVSVELTEVEAYAGSGDPASHAYRGPRPRTTDLFGPPGTMYCYLSHGLHLCGNIVCGWGGTGSAVLLRAGKVVGGVETVRERRGGVADEALARGPGNLGKAMGWTLADSGRVLGEGALTLELGSPAGRVVAGPRVGVSLAYTRPWRFWVDGDPTVSAYRRSPRVMAGRCDW